VTPLCPFFERFMAENPLSEPKHVFLVYDGVGEPEKTVRIGTSIHF
jgi:hypothetical protein